LNAAGLARGTAITGLLATMLFAGAWLGPPAVTAGGLAVVALVLLLLPLLLGIRGLWQARLRTGRWLSLALPFYGAAILVAAVGNPAARGWVTASAFSVALALAAVLSWVRRAAPRAPP
jgi:uncharacterized membrane protein